MGQIIVKLLITIVVLTAVQNTVFARAFVNKEKQWFDKDVYNSYGIIVVKDGKVLYKKMADGYDLDTPHYLHSIGKIILSAYIGSKVKEKTLNLDDRLSLMNPNANVSWSKDLSLNHVLRMSSGLHYLTDRFDEDLGLGVLAIKVASGEHFYNGNLENLVQIYRPGHYKYSIVDQALLIEYLKQKIGDRSLRVDIKDFSKMLGLNATNMKFSNRDSLFDLSLTPFIHLNYERAIIRDHFYSWASLDDLVKISTLFLDNYYNRDTIMEKGWARRSWVGAKKSKNMRRKEESESYGALWYVNELNQSERKIFPMLNENVRLIKGRYSQFVSIEPEENLIIIRVGGKAKKNLDREVLITDLKEYLKI